MNKIVALSLDSPVVQMACTNAIGDQYGTQKEMASAIWHWIHNRVRFVTDEQTMIAMGIPIQNPTKELLIAPGTLLSMPEPQGDCDDFSMLAKTMLMICGMRCSFITVKADREEPKNWSHIYCKVYFDDGTSMPFDASHGQWPGWETKNYMEKREWA